MRGVSLANSLRRPPGDDVLTGGPRNDTYLVDVATDVINEGPSAGIDLVKSATHHTLSPNLENLKLTGSAPINATGNSAPNVLTGNSAANGLNGGARNDSLNGGCGNDSLVGGSGSDSLVGGAGNDTYRVNISTDVISENAASGIDLVQSAANYTLTTNLENLKLRGMAALDGTGNSLANLITGNSGANILDGAGTSSGIGQKDSSTGGGGADIFVLGTSAGCLYDDGNPATAGKADYLHITDFKPLTGDKLQLSGTAAQYLVGASPFSVGQAIFFDSDNNGAQSTHDELIAIVRSTPSLDLLTHASFIP